MQYVTQEGETEVQVAVTVQSPLDLIMERVSGNFTVSLSAGGTATGMHVHVKSFKKSIIVLKKSAYTLVYPPLPSPSFQ